MAPGFLNVLAIIFLVIGIGSFISVLVIWLFRLYPQRKRFLKQLKKELGLKYPKETLIIKKGKLKGFYRDYEITVSPFTGGGNSWILLKCPNSRNFRGIIKSRKLLKVFREPIDLLRTGRELVTKNLEFDKRFRVITTATFPITEILSPSIQARLLQLVKKEEFEIQIIQGGVFFTSEKEIQDLSLANFIFDTLVEIAKNLGFYLWHSGKNS